MKTDIRPFTEEFVAEAGALLAQRHKRNRASLPLLPARFEDVELATQTVQGLWQEKLKNGYAAFRDGKMTAYLLGEYAVQPWGRSGYVYLPGYALADWESKELIKDLYALLGDDWVRKGVFNHYFYISRADQNVIDAFFEVGLGIERVDALLDLRMLNIPQPDLPASITVRRAAPGDAERLGSVSHIIMNALASAPYWHPTMPEDYAELKDGWSELAADATWKVWAAFERDDILGTVGFRPVEEDDPQMLCPPHAVYLSVAATKPEARARGIAHTLTWSGLDEARKDGFEICYTNWISSNLLAARYWPRFGFAEVSYRLAKKVNPMIAWTRTSGEG